MNLIKKAFCIIVIIIITLLFSINITNAVEVEITTETLNLRKEPSTSSDIVAQISIGDTCELIEDEGDWYYVEYGEYTGYISSEYAEIIGDSSDNSNNDDNNTTSESDNELDSNTSNNTTTDEEDTSTDDNGVTENNENNKNVTATLNENTNIKILPLINSSNLETIKENTEVTIITQINGWSYVQTDEVSGWLRSDTLTIENNADTNSNNSTSDNSSDNNDDDTDENGENDNSTFETRTMYTNDTYVNIRAEASTSSERIMVVEQNTALTVIGETGDWYMVETSQGNGYVSKELLSEEKTTVTNRGSVDRTSSTETQDKENEDEAEVGDTSTSNSVSGAEIVEYAKEFLGVSYVYGGASPSGFDCSGFTMYVYSHFGISMNHGAQSQSKLGEEVSVDKSSKSSILNNLQVGDLVFFLDYETMDEIGHCGIYIGDGNFIHASSGSGYCVKINSLLPGEYYNTRYCSSRRII